jgi:hypothetical protein
MAVSAVNAAQLHAIMAWLDPKRFTTLQRDLMTRVVFTVESSVKKRTPVLTGHLRRSITGDVISVDRGRVGTNVIYAAVVNRRNPYMQNGINDAQSGIDSLLAAFANDFAGG